MVFSIASANACILHVSIQSWGRLWTVASAFSGDASDSAERRPPRWNLNAAWSSKLMSDDLGLSWFIRFKIDRTVSKNIGKPQLINQPLELQFYTRHVLSLLLSGGFCMLLLCFDFQRIWRPIIENWDSLWISDLPCGLPDFAMLRWSRQGQGQEWRSWEADQDGFSQEEGLDQWTGCFRKGLSLLVSHRAALSSDQAAGFECTMSCSANLEIMITIIHWGAFQDEGMNCALVKESAARPPAESDKGKTGNWREGQSFQRDAVSYAVFMPVFLIECFQVRKRKQRRRRRRRIRLRICWMLDQCIMQFFFFGKGMYIWFLCMKEGQTASCKHTSKFAVCRELRLRWRKWRQ